MRVVCHIGTPKTATSYLQETFARNPGWLAKQGVLYPDMKSGSNHITLHLLSSDKIDVFGRSHGLGTKQDILALRQDLGDHLRQQIEAAGPDIHTVVLSSENLTGNTGPQGLPVLREFLRGIFDDVKIVAYVRNQDEAILSMYAEYMRMGFRAPIFDEFITAVLSQKTYVPHLDVKKIFHDWRQHFGPGNVTIKLFDRNALKDGDILADFLDVVLPRAEVDLSTLKPSDFKRDSLSAPSLEFLRMIQPMVPFAVTGKENPARKALSKKIDALPRSPKPQMSYAQSLRIMSHFIDANTWLHKHFFPHLELSYFGPNPALPAASNLSRISTTEFREFSNLLFKP